MNGELLIRESRDADVASIAAIYTHHVLHGVASFEETPPTVEEMGRRRGELLARGLPYFVAEREGRVVGYCYAGPYRARSGYRFSLEDSIYIDAGEVGRGVGRMLLATVLERSTALGYRQMIAVIGGADTLPSIRLHEAMGFTHIGAMTGIGFKFGRWIDSVLMQRALGPGNTALPGRGRKTMAFADPAAIKGYHAHIYYDPANTKPVAAKLREGIAAAFPAVTIGSWHDEAVGPHAVSMYQVVFSTEEFARIVPWLMLNRDVLDVLVHPLAGSAYDDHTIYAMWLGDKQPLRLDVLRRVAA